MAQAASSGLLDLKVWEDLQAKIEDDTKIRDQIRDIVQDLEKSDKIALSSLTNAFSSASGAPSIRDLEGRVLPPLIRQIHALSDVASRHPYYKFNGMWTRAMQDATFAILLCGWFGGHGTGKEGELLSIEQVGGIMNVPVNLKDRDAFHLTIEEYLHSLVSLIDELARLARTSVTQGNCARPLLISRFVKDLHAGFQTLNLKNDSLRRRSDSVKYKVREVEDVVYDLVLRGLVKEG